MLRVGVQVLLQFRQWHSGTYGEAVADNVEVASPEVDDPVTVRIRDVRITDVPFVRDDPIEYLGAAWHLVSLERNVLCEHTQRLAHAVSGDTATDRVQPPDEAMHLLAGAVRELAEGGSTGMCRARRH
jgi:hypothetical protein